MDHDDTASTDERSIELSSIEAIFPELRIDPSNPFRASLEISVDPEKPLKIFFQASVQSVPPTSQTLSNPADPLTITSINPAAAKVDIHELSHLPPLTVTLFLPEGYPTSLPPQVELSSKPQWIPRSMLRTLTEACENLWKEIGQDQVVYSYIDHLQQSAESAFNVELGPDRRFELPGDLKISLLDFDLRKRKEQFEKETFDCGICLEPKKGAHCHRLNLCGHVFCVQCLQDFYNNAITEGDVDGVKCLSPGCGKDDVQDTPGKRRRKMDRTLNPSELLQIPMQQEQVQRYVMLKRKKKLEADKNTIYCPRRWCQGAAKSKRHPKPSDLLSDFAESESDPETENETLDKRDLLANGTSKKKKSKVDNIPMSERLAVCEDCDFAFCSVCLRGWHGVLASCHPPRRQAELDEEEKATLAYLEQYSTPCPTCRSPAQKTMGCNHMICFQCRTHFCYLCSAYLMPENPYSHFNDFKSTCYMRLWELEGGDGAGVREGEAGNAVAWNPEDFNTDSDDESDADGDLSDSEDEAIIPHGRQIDANVAPEPARDGLVPGRNLHIEIVNFAANGVNQRIRLPDQPNNAVPPPVPNPPRRGGAARQGNRRGANAPVPNRHGNRAARPGVAGRVDPAAGRAQNVVNRAGGPAAVPARVPARGNALDRFLELALNDQEDEWDSDELEDVDFDEDDHEPPRNRRRALA